MSAQKFKGYFCNIIWNYAYSLFKVMSNDLSRGLFPAREVKLLIVDEAHKAQGEYAYCQVAKELNRSQVGEGDISR